MHNHLSAFHWDTKVGEFLFPGLNVNGAGGIALLSIVLVLICIVYESVKVLQTQTRARSARERQRAPSCPPSETANLLSVEQQNAQSRNFSNKFLEISTQAIIFLFHNTLGYILMLSVMVYNVYVFFAVIFGLGMGYFLFGHISMKTNMENIRARTTNALCDQRIPNDPSTSGVDNPTTASNLNDASSSSSSSTDSNCHANYSSFSRNPDEVAIYPSKSQDSNITHSCRL